MEENGDAVMVDWEEPVQLELTYFNDLPEELVIKLLSYLSPYTDTKSAKLVNRKWNRLIISIEKHCQRMFLESLKTCNIMWKIRKQRSYDITETLLPRQRGGSTFCTKVQKPNTNVPCPRFSHVSVVLGQYMYVFGGSSSEHSNTSSTFNDFYRLDLSDLRWYKVKAEGLLPAPRECCTMVAFKQHPIPHKYQTIPYKGKIVIFGGFCQPPLDRMIIGPRFFDDTQIFHVPDSRWQRINVNGHFPAARAGHSASIIGSKMIIFGGSQRNNRLNDVWVFDIEALAWTCPYIRGQKPGERFGHSQFTINEKMIMIFGGCGGPTDLFSDGWLLDITTWSWSQIAIGNQYHQPHDLWCHTSLMVNGDIVVFSEEKKCPYCRCPIQTFNVPKVKPNGKQPGDVTECTCGRKNPDDMVQMSQAQLQMYILDCENLISNSTCRWLDYKYLSPSPPTRKLFSATVGINEILIFGGLQNNSNVECKVDDCTIVISAGPP